ncbi:MAG: hypothetical protein KAT68_19625 [Bacteroidales bacterium]|nr:hypothetical protein [Bacteroidales bacterium]
MEYNSAFAKIAELAGILNVKSIKDLPGLWIYEIDKHWKIKLNGHKEEIDNIPPYRCVIEFNGFPAGIINPYGGTIAGGIANEDSFIEAIDNKMKKLIKHFPEKINNVLNKTLIEYFSKMITEKGNKVIKESLEED